MHSLFRNTLIIGAIFGVLNARAAESGDGSIDLKPVVIRAGLYDIKASTTLRADSTDGSIGTVLNFEDDLNVADHKRTGFISGRFRIGKRHFVELEYFSLDRRGRRTLDGSIDFGDQSYEIGAEVESYMDTTVYRLGYAYRIVARPTWGVAISAGLHLTEIGTGITELTLDQPLAIENLEVVRATAPLPVIGVSGAWRIADDWQVLGRLQLFRLEFDKYAGQLDHVSLSLENNTFENVGFGIGYDFFGIDVDVEKKRWNGAVNFEFRGPMIFVKASF